MKKTIIIALLMNAVSGTVFASNYDQSLEEAAQRRIAEKIGPLRYVLRGTFGIYEQPERVVQVHYKSPSVAAKTRKVNLVAKPGWQDGMVKAAPFALRKSIASLY